MKSGQKCGLKGSQELGMEKLHIMDKNMTHQLWMQGRQDLIAFKLGESSKKIADPKNDVKLLSKLFWIQPLFRARSLCLVVW